LIGGFRQAEILMSSSSAFERRYSHYHHAHHREKTHPPKRKPVSPALKIGAAIAILALAAWSGVTSFYIFFRDDALHMLVSHQTNMVRGYDAQIAALQTQVQRLQSLKLVEQERVDRTVAELAKKQAIVEQRQNSLAELTPKPASAVPPPRVRDTKSAVPDTFPVLEPAAETKPSPISDKIVPAPSRARSSEARKTTNFAILDRSRPIESRLKDLSEDIAQAEARQQETLDRVAQALDAKEIRARSVLARLGIAAHSSDVWPAIGGPFIPFLKAKGNAFDQKLAKTQEIAGKLAELNTLLQSVPVRFPVPRQSEITSGFGARADPFFHQLALHSGVDFRGAPGELVRAAAAGRVTNASYQGGYGLMVEIDHGKGLVTRYGHLSAIEANVGEAVQPGDVIGRIGTTGRSTGPHLHYEVRVSGEATDPMRYLRAGEELDGTSTAAFPAAATRSASKTRLISTD
jgi:murein DD-endopeptidase MepM/ murein hydrolase activator NlpD